MPLPLLFEYFFSTRSIISSSLVVRQIERVRECVVIKETNLGRESRIARKLAGRSSLLRLYFSHKSHRVTMIFAIPASLFITLSHSSLCCSTS